MTVGVHRRQAVRRLVVGQLDHLQLARLRVLVLGLHRLLRVAITEAELIAGNVRLVDGDDRQRLAGGALPALARHDQQLAFGHLGGAVVLLGQAGDKVVIRLIALVDALDLGVDRARHLPAVALGDFANDLRQRHVLPAAATHGLAAAAHVAGLAANHDGVGRPAQFHLVDGVRAQAGQPLALVAHHDQDVATACRQRNSLVAVVNAQLELVRLHAGLVRGA